MAAVVVAAEVASLAVIFKQSFFHLLAVAIAVCGAAGLGLVAAGVPEAPIAVVSGVVPGAILLAAAWWGAQRTTSTTPRGDRPDSNRVRTTSWRVDRADFR